MKITLRKRKMKSGKTSFYLDIYHKDGKREYEYLNLYLVPIKSPFDRKHNKETAILAESIRSERQLQLQSGKYGFKNLTDGNKDFLEFFRKLRDERFQSKGNHDNWDSTYKHLEIFSKGHCKFSDLTAEFLEGFKDYLTNAKKLNSEKEGLAQNSALSYFNKLRASINKAFELKLLNENPCKYVKSLKQEDTRREFLSFEEIQRLFKTECSNPVLKRAFLFSCLSGLRWSDIFQVTWNDLSYSDANGWLLTFSQQKTKGLEHLPVSEQARDLLGEKGKSHEKIFKALKYSAYTNVELSRWVLMAGITKKITFHCARHTHATLLLTNGVDIYTVSKLLGHQHLKTTEIYAKIIDDKKIKAVNAIPMFSKPILK